MDCGVCFDTNKTSVCGCGFAACAPCTKKYLLGSFDDAHCMSCRRGLTRADLVAMLGPTFVSGAYKTHREKILYDRERAMLPATQTRLANFRLARELMGGLVAKKDRLRALKAEVARLAAEIANDQNTAYRLANARYEDRRPHEDAQVPRVVVERILCGCPVSGCNGFVRASDHACGACHVKICKDCHAKDDDDHECDPADVETAKLVRKETKPCPRCNVPIFRSSGCYQMFCTQCQCVFDWGNGQEIRNEAVHNPHYFEWLEKTGGNVAHGRLPECGGFGRVYSILRLIHNAQHAPIGAYRSITNRVRDAIHVREVVVPRLHNPNIVQDNTVLRLKFLDNMISEKEFKSTLQRNEKRQTKEWELRQILEMYAEAVAAIVNSIGTVGEGDELPTVCARDVVSVVDQMDALDEYTNTQLSTLSKVFGMKPQPISHYGRY